MMEILVPYAIYDNGGTIIQTGHCLTSSLTAQTSVGRSVAVGVADRNLNYVLNGNILAFTGTEIATKSNLQQGFVWKMPDRIALDTRDLQTSQAQAWERVKLVRSTKEVSPFTCNGSVYDANMTNISGAVQLATLAQVSGAPYTVNWTLFDNTIKTLDASGIIAVGVALGSIISNIYDTARTLRSAIQACTTNAQADAITWPD